MSLAVHGSKELKGFRATIGKDALASIVVFLVALPLCMGVAIASGVSPMAGLITGVVGGLVVGLIAGSPLQVSGPAAGLTVLIWQLVQHYGMGMLGVIVLLAGLIQLLAGLLKLGQWFRAVSPAVIHGMLAGIGILIFASQFHVMIDKKPIGSGMANFAGIPAALMDTFSCCRHFRPGVLHRFADHRIDRGLEQIRTQKAGGIAGASRGGRRGSDCFSLRCI